MKRIILSTIVLLTVGTAFGQTNQPDAEYNLIRRSYRTVGDSITEIRFHKEIVLLRNRAITAYADKGETFITYNPDFENLTINECYTIRPDGTKVNTPANAFVKQLPSECVDCGRLNHITEMAIVHTALEYNCTIVLDYTLRRRASFLVERFNLAQDCPVKRYEIRYADGHTDVHNNIAQTVNDPYMPVVKSFDVEFQLGQKPVYTTEKSLPEAGRLLASLNSSNSKEYATAIRDWVVDYITLNPVNPARVNYVMTPAIDVFNSNCGTAIDKTGLLAALLNQAGFRAEIVDNSLNVFGDRPLEVEVTIDGLKYRLSATAKTPLLTESEQADAAAVAAAPIYVDRKLDWNPDTIVDNYVRVILPSEKGSINIDPTRLNASRTSDLQARATTEFYHYTMELPKGAKLIGGDVNIEYNRNVGSISIIIKQKGKRLLVTRSLRLRKALITRADYSDFRQLMIDWNSHRELFFSL